MSYPLKAATLSGMVRVCRGSTKPSRGLRARLAIPVLAPSSSKSKMATPVVSLPVPAVVGTRKFKCLVELAGSHVRSGLGPLLILGRTYKGLKAMAVRLKWHKCNHWTSERALNYN